MKPEKPRPMNHIVDYFQELIECFMEHRGDRRPEIHSLEEFYQAFYRLQNTSVCAQVEGDLYRFYQMCPTAQRFVLKQHHARYFPERIAAP